MFDLADNRAAKMLAHGRVTITFKSPSGNHITVLAKAKAPVHEKWIQVPLSEAKIIWLEVPNPEGFNDRIGKFTGSKGFVPSNGADKARIYCAKTLIAYVRGHAVDGRLKIRVEDRCAICGKQLTDPISIDRGIGPDCLGKATGSTHQAKVKVTPKKPFDWRAHKKDLQDHLSVDKGKKLNPKREAKEVIVPAVMDACIECDTVDGTVLFGYCSRHAHTKEGVLNHA